MNNVRDPKGGNTPKPSYKVPRSDLTPAQHAADMEQSRMNRADSDKAVLREALQACVDLMVELPTLNGFVGLAVLENAKDVLERTK